MEEAAYANGAQYTEDQSYQQEQSYEQTNETGDGGKRFRDDDEKKLFVGGLSTDTKEEDLKTYFSKFGPITNCVLKTDTETGRSRCFGFIVFEAKESLEESLRVPKEEHIINGKQVDPKKAKARPPYGGGGGNRKIFVGGVAPSVEESEIREVFSQYGTIDAVDLPTEKKPDGREERRGFIFISFEDEDTVTALVEKGSVELAGKSVDIKRATPKQEHSGRGGFGGRGGRGGRGGNRGGYNNQWDNGYNNQWGGPGGQWGGNGYDYRAWNQGGGGGYGGYGGYGGPYDYSGYGGGWGGPQWGQGGWNSWGPGYDPSSYNYSGYGDYSGGWGNYGGYEGGEGGTGDQQQGGGSSGSSYKARGGGTGGGKGYHPYSR